jgi:carboxypeptidase C (cathepsin A)
MRSALAILLACFSVLACAQLGETNGYGPEKVQQYSGYITVDGSPDNGTHLFYWMFESRNNPSTDPFLVWLTGGPGCSSLLALFQENGPYTIGSGTNLNLNPYSWNSNATVLYVDQPVGTGFSYADNSADYAHDEKTIANVFYTFLGQFFALHPKYQNLPFFVFGESYAGHYVPAISARIVQGGGVKINFKGAGIGNGLVDPVIQNGEYGPFSLDNKLIGKITYDATEVAYGRCRSAIDKGDYSTAFEVCNGIIDIIRLAAGNFNPYDIRKQCTYQPLCYNMQPLENLLATSAVRTALGIPSKVQWQMCDQTVYYDLIADFEQAYQQDLPPVLAAGVRVLVYSGMEDFICNYYGGGNWTAALPWPGQAQFNNTALAPWTVGGQVAGYIKTVQGFSWFTVLNAGHMVPMDQPQVALTMLNSFFSQTGPFAPSASDLEAEEAARKYLAYN